MSSKGTRTQTTEMGGSRPPNSSPSGRSLPVQKAEPQPGRKAETNKPPSSTTIASKSTARKPDISSQSSGRQPGGGQKATSVAIPPRSGSSGRDATQKGRAAVPPAPAPASQPRIVRASGPESIPAGIRLPGSQNGGPLSLRQKATTQPGTTTTVGRQLPASVPSRNSAPTASIGQSRRAESPAGGTRPTPITARPGSPAVGVASGRGAKQAVQTRITVSTSGEGKTSSGSEGAVGSGSAQRTSRSPGGGAGRSGGAFPPDAGGVGGSRDRSTGRGGNDGAAGGASRQEQQSDPPSKKHRYLVLGIDGTALNADNGSTSANGKQHTSNVRKITDMMRRQGDCDVQYCAGPASDPNASSIANASNAALGSGNSHFVSD